VTTAAVVTFKDRAHAAAIAGAPRVMCFMDLFDVFNLS
jgi:hypothetical protein